MPGDRRVIHPAFMQVGGEAVSGCGCGIEPETAGVAGHSRVDVLGHAFAPRPVGVVEQFGDERAGGRGSRLDHVDVGETLVGPVVVDHHEHRCRLGAGQEGAEAVGRCAVHSDHNVLAFRQFLRGPDLLGTGQPRQGAWHREAGLADAHLHLATRRAQRRAQRQGRTERVRVGVDVRHDQHPLRAGNGGNHLVPRQRRVGHSSSSPGRAR